MGKIVFIGAGGSGVSALAHLFLQLGYTNLLGIEKNKTEAAATLEEAWLPITYEFGSYDVQPDDLVIYSAAWKHVPEVKQAKQLVGSNHKRVAPPLLYFQFLGELSKYFQTVAVTGTHGKSTTTWLIAHTLSRHHPQFWLTILGAWVTDRDGNNFHYNHDKQKQIKAIVDHIVSPKWPSVAKQMKELLFVVEADEYNKHFLYLDTDYGCITNLELDHSDIYPTEQDYIDTYLEFATDVKQQIFMHNNNSFIDKFTSIAAVQPVTTQQFSFEHLLWWHNHANASLALACCTELGVAADKATQTLESFSWLRRRAELIGTTPSGAQIISDYAHHPTEIASTYTALQEQYPNKELVCIFQPHQVRRVLEFRDQFVKQINKIDTCHLYDIYAARENFDDLKEQFANDATRNVSSVDELGNLLAETTNQDYTTSFEHIKTILTDTTPDQIIVIFSAGDIDYEIRNRLHKTQEKK